MDWKEIGKIAILIEACRDELDSMVYNVTSIKETVGKPLDPNEIEMVEALKSLSKVTFPDYMWK